MYCPYCGEENEGDNQFCMFCGQTMPGHEEKMGTPTLGVGQIPYKPKEKTKIPVRQISVIVGAALFIIAVITIGIFVVPRVFSGMKSDHYIYVRQDTSTSGGFSSIVLSKADGKSDFELAGDRVGYYPVDSLYGLQQRFISPTGNHFFLRERGLRGDLLLFSNDGSIPVYLSDKSSAGWPEGFSPDGKYLAFTTFDQTNIEIATHIVDNSGNLILTLEGAMFGAFLPDSNKVVVVETELVDEFFTSLILVDINRGDITFLASLDMDGEEVSYLFPPRPFVSPDGRQVYFFSGMDLMSVPISGGAVSTVYRFDSQASSAYFAPDKKHLVLLDVEPGFQEADLLLFDPQSNRRIRIDSEIYIRDRIRSMYGEENIKFSPDGKTVAYLVIRDERLELYVYNIERRQRTRLASGSAWISFAFSPDGKRIAYIDSRSATSGGNLFISELDGSDRKRLDTDVWSFQFDARSRNIYYFTVDDASRRRPESEMFKIRIDGTKKEMIMPAENGILTFIDYRR
jgi:Tol biopolymer transport system component